MRLPPNRSFRLLLAGTVVSQLGDWSARLALALLVFERTESDFMVGVTTALLTLPWLGLGQWLAQKADRIDRRRLLVGCDVARGVMVLTIAFVSMPLAVLMVLVLAVATIDPVFEANRSAMIADVVTKDDYAGAIQAIHGVNQVAQLAGFGLGGLLVAQFSPSGALALNGFSFFGSALLILLVEVGREASRRRGAAPSFKQAFAFLGADHLSRIAVVSTVLTVALANAVESQLPVYGKLVSSMNPTAIGVLAAIVPLATLLCIWALDSSGEDVPLLRRGATFAAVCAVPASGLLWVGWNRVSIFVGYACLGGIFVLSTTGNIVAGRRIPPEIRVGTFAVLQASVYVGVGVGAFGGGLVSEWTSPKFMAGTSLALCAVVCLAAIAAISRYDAQGATKAEPVSTPRGDSA